MLGIKIYIVFVVIISMLLAGFYWYYKDSQNTIKIQAENIAKQEIAIKEQSAVLNKLEEQTTLLIEETNNLQINLQNAEEDNRKLSSMLRKHDLEELSRAKPKLIENRINKGTKSLFLELEEITKIDEKDITVPAN